MEYPLRWKAVNDFHDKNIGERVHVSEPAGQKIIYRIDRHNPNTGKTELELVDPKYIESK